MSKIRCICGISLLTIAVLLWSNGIAQSYMTGLPTDYQASVISSLGGTSSRAYDINNNRDVVGYGTTVDGYRNAVVWHDTNGNGLVDPGEVNGLGTLGGSESVAVSINDSGLVISWARMELGNSSQQAMLWTDRNGNWRLDSGETAGLGTLGGSISRGYSINESGQVAGCAYTSTGVRKAMRWTDANANGAGDPGEVTSLGTLGGMNAYSMGINNLGDVVGYSSTPSGPDHAFRWIDTDHNGALTPGEVVDLGTLGGTTSRAWAINDSGIIAGEAELASGNTHAFIYNDLAGMVDLGTLGGDNSIAYGINKYGHVVGTAQDAEGVYHAYIWDGIGMTDLNDLLPAESGWVLTMARGINDKDELAGWGYYNGQQMGFVMTHAPEPATLLLLGSGVIGFILRRRKSGE